MTTYAYVRLQPYTLQMRISPNAEYHRVLALALFVCRVICAKVIVATSSEDFLVIYGNSLTVMIVMVALCNRADHYIYIFMLFLSSFSFFISSPDLSGRRFDVYHTLAHGVALVQI